MTRLPAVIAILACTLLSAFAQPNELTLESCISLAMEHNQTLQQTRAAVQSASASVTGAFGNFLPSLTLGLGYTRHLDQNNSLTRLGSGGTVYQSSSPYTYSISGNANYLVFNGFANTATYERASRVYDAAELTLKRSRQDISYQVTQGYLNVMRTMQIMKSREENLKVTKEQLDRVRAQFDVGSVPHANVLQQETQAANDEVAYLQSRNDWYNARNDLLSLMGVDPSVEYAFSSTSVPSTISPDEQKMFRQRSGTVQEAISRAIASRYDVDASRNRLLGDEASISVARGGYYPTVNVSLGYGWNNYQFDNFSDYSSTTLGLNLSMPIFDRFVTRTNVYVAEAQYQTTQATHELLLQQVRVQVKRAYYDLETTELQLAATDHAIQSATENKRTAEERYKLGAGTVLDYLTAEAQFLTADVNRVNAVYGYLGSKSNVEYLTAMTNR